MLFRSQRAADAILRYGCKLLVIDPWNELDHIPPDGMSLTQYTGHAIREIKRFARKYQVHVIVVAHPAKMTRGSDGTYPIPTLYDISDSAHWANKPDLGMIVYCNEYNLTLVKVLKCRYVGVIGQRGQVTLRFNDYLNNYIKMTPEDVRKHVDDWKAANGVTDEDEKQKAFGFRKRKKKSIVAD